MNTSVLQCTPVYCEYLKKKNEKVLLILATSEKSVYTIIIKYAFSLEI